MERLTLEQAISHCIECGKQHKQLAEWLEELKYYKELKARDRLIELPCKVGDTVYEVQEIRKRIQEYAVIYVNYNNHSLYYGWRVKDGKGIYSNLSGFKESDIGKTVFLTKEEAEAKLKEMEGGKWADR